MKSSKGMFTERLAPARAPALAHEQVQVRLPVLALEAQVVPRQWFEATRRFAEIAARLKTLIGLMDTTPPWLAMPILQQPARSRSAATLPNVPSDQILRDQKGRSNLWTGHRSLQLRFHHRPRALCRLAATSPCANTASLPWIRSSGRTP